MHLFKNAFVAVLFVAAAGCTGSTPNAKTGDGGTTDSAASEDKRAECSVVESKFKQLDDARNGAKGSSAAGRSIVPALEKMSKEFKEAPMKTPGLDKATVELVTEADSFVAKMKEMNPAFDEIEQVNQVLLAWQTKLEKASEEFDMACSKAPRAECDAMGQRVTNIPHLDGHEYGSYADAMEKFLKVAGEYDIADAGLRTSWKTLLSVLGEATKPMHRLAELWDELKKREPPVAQLKAKLNQVREMCGIPVRK
jgi:hypothetical protein